MKNTVGKILLLLSILFALNALYRHTAFTSFVEKEAGEYLQAQKVANADMVYVSESSNFSPQNSSDTNRRKLSQFLSDYFPDKVFEAINKPASHAGIYKQVLAAIPEENQISTIIIAVNMRSFGASWINSHLETALNKSAVFYNNRPVLLNRFLMGLNAYDKRSTREREKELFAEWAKETLPHLAPRNSVKNWTALEKWGDWKHPKRQLADHYIKQYAFVLDESNQRVTDLDEIVQLAENKGWKLVLSILAENVEEARDLVGAELVSLMKQNRDWLSTRYQNIEHVQVIDNMEILRLEAFTEKNFPSEHYSESGRRKIAKNIATKLRNNL